jgi:hypothetical protein
MIALYRYTIVDSARVMRRPGMVAWRCRPILWRLRRVYLRISSATPYPLLYKGLCPYYHVGGLLGLC